MKIQSLFASVRSFRILSAALPIAALLCAAPLTRAARADAAPQHIYLFNTVFGLEDATTTFDGSSVVSMSGEVIYVNFVVVPDSLLTGAGGHTTDLLLTGAGGHTTDISLVVPDSLLTGAGGHTTDLLTGAGGHTTDLVLDANNEVVGIVAP